MDIIAGQVENFAQAVGRIEETSEKRYRFTYSKAALESVSKCPVSLTLPLRSESYESDRLFGFFDGLIPEGWLLSISARQWKIDRHDRMRLLLAVCSDCIGSVSVFDSEDVTRRAAAAEVVEIPSAAPKSAAACYSTQICLSCLGQLGANELLYHPSCARRLFGSADVPMVHADSANIERLGAEVANQRLALTGVQRKLSMSLERDANSPQGRLTIVGLWGEYILKPAPLELPSMAANELLTMLLAQAMNLPVPSFGLLPLQDGSLAYIVRRFDRERRKQKSRELIRKRSVEDFGQLFDRNQGAQKYGSSYNQIGRWIREHSHQPGLDLSRLFELTLFSFLVGNSDLHLKNISIFTYPRTLLTPFYDLVSVEALEPGDIEELALPINGKRNKLTRKDWIEFGLYLGLSAKPIERMLERFRTLAETAKPLIENAFIPDAEKARFEKLLESRLERL